MKTMTVYFFPFHHFFQNTNIYEIHQKFGRKNSKIVYPS